MIATTHPKRRTPLLALIGMLAVVGSLLVAPPAFAAETGSIAGRVVHEDGSPASAGQFRVSFRTGGTSGTEVADAATSSDGSFLVDGLPTLVTYSVVVIANVADAYPQATAGTTFRLTAPGERREIGDVVVLPYRTLDGYVLLPTRQRAPQGSVTVTAGPLGGPHTTVPVDSNGRFAFSGLPPATVWISVDYLVDDAVLDRARFALTATRDSSVSNLELVLEHGYVFSGSVTLGTADMPAGPGTYVQISSPGKPTLTDSVEAGGAFSFSGVPGATYTVAIYRNLDGAGEIIYRTEFRTVVLADGDDVTDYSVTLSPDTAITGTVTSSTPQSGVRVELWSFDGPADDYTLVESDLTDHRGYYKFADLEPGRYEIRFQPAAPLVDETWDDVSPYYFGDLIELEDGETFAADAELGWGTAFYGYIHSTDFGADDFASMGVEVYVYDYSEEGWVGTGDVYSVDADGRYGIPRIYPDAYTLVATYNGSKGVAVDVSETLVGEPATQHRWDFFLGWPVPLVEPSVSGASPIGTTWVLNTGIWAGVPTPVIVQAWLRCSSPITTSHSAVPTGCVAISGATGTSYTSTAADAGKYLTAQVAGINAGGSTNTVALTTIATTGPTPPTVTTAPTVTGNNAVGSTWTLDPGVWAGTPAPRVVQAWLRCNQPITAIFGAVPAGCVAINGANGLTYVSTSADGGKYITAQVAGINTAGTVNTGVAQTLRTDGPTPPTVTTAPTVTGNNAVGSTWTLDPGVWAGTPAPRVVQAWLRCNQPITAIFGAVPAGCVAINGANGLTYVSTSADGGKYITAQVAGINTAGTVNTGVAQTLRTDGPTPPTVTTAPTVTGNNAVGSTWTLDPGVWAGTPAPRVVQAWLRCNQPITAIFGAVPAGCVAINGANGLTYVSTSADGGKYITAQVAGINTAGTVNTGVAQTLRTDGPTPPTVTTAPTVTGNNAVGSTWTLDPGVWAGTPAPRVVQAWLRCNQPITAIFGAVPAGCVAINGANGLTYVSTSADGGKYITAQVAGINTAGTVNTGVAQTLRTDGPTPPTVTTAPTVTGNNAVGSTWTLDPGVWAGTPAPRVVQAWLRCNQPITAIFGAVPAGCVAINGANGLTYVSTSADGGKYITAQVAGINTAGTVNTGVAQTLRTDGPTPPTVTTAPTVTGNNAVGSTWTLDPGVWAGTPAPRVVQAWLRCNQPITAIFGAVPAGCVAINGANGLTYVSTSADGGKYITAQVAGINTAGTVNTGVAQTVATD